MSRKKILMICAVIFALILLAVCIFISSRQDNSDTTAAPDIDPVSLYTQASKPLQSAEQLSYYIATEQTTTLEDQKFTRVSQQRLNIQDPGKASMHSSMVASLDFGALSVDLSEYYENGKGYVTVGENTFTSLFSADDFSRRYAPADCFEPTLYADVQAVSFGNGTAVLFNKPSAAESWALPQDAVFTDASGYALLDATGALQESMYTVSYRIGTANTTQSTKVIITGNFQVKSPKDPDAAIAIECFDAPILLEQACGYLLQAETVGSNAETNIDCQTFSIHRTQKSNLTFSGDSEDFYALLDVQIDQVNQSRGGETSQIRQTETFKSGKYSISVNGAASTDNEAIDAAAMKSYCQDMLIGNILLPKHIAGADAEETDTEIILTFQASDALAEAICSNICSTLYSDSQLLHTISSDYNTQSMQCSLILDKYTGLPLSFSSEYSAYHTIEEISYQLESKTQQSYQY